MIYPFSHPPGKTLLCTALALALSVLPAISWSADNPKPIKASEFRTCSGTMEITDVRFSASADIGLKVTFDDIGCAIIWRNLQSAMDQTAFDSTALARDFNDLSTVIMSQAHYVLSKKLKTPIGFGIAAFSDKGSAKAFIKESGSGNLMSYRDLIKLDLRPPEPPDPSGEKKDGK